MGIITDFNEEHEINAKAGIIVTVSGITTLAALLQQFVNVEHTTAPTTVGCRVFTG